MSWAALVIGGVSVGLSLYSSNEAKKAAAKEAELQREGGDKRRDAAFFEANVLEQQATARIAAGQRDALDQTRTAKLAVSRAVALGAASGGGVSTSPTVLNIVGGIAKEGAYNSARALYQAEESARLLRLEAFEKRRLGEFGQVGGNLQALAAEERGKAAQFGGYATAVGTVGGLYGKYGGRGPGDVGDKSAGGTGTGTDLDV